MLSSYLTDALVRQQSTVEQLKTTDTTGAVLTLTRTAVLAITTAGTNITWQSELRNYQFSWSGVTITIPSTGWYLISLNAQISSNINDVLISLVINGNNVVQSAGFIGDVDRNRFHATFMRFFEEGDTFAVRLAPTLNVDLSVNAEGGPGESPILNVVQLSGGVDV